MLFPSLQGFGIQKLNVAKNTFSTYSFLPFLTTLLETRFKKKYPTSFSDNQNYRQKIYFDVGERGDGLDTRRVWTDMFSSTFFNSFEPNSDKHNNYDAV